MIKIFNPLKRNEQVQTSVATANIPASLAT